MKTDIITIIIVAGLVILGPIVLTGAIYMLDACCGLFILERW